MTGRSHLLIGGFAVLCAMRWHVLSPEPFSVCTGLLGSLLPDIDTERSMLGARVKFLSRFLARTFGHRGITHSGVVLLLIAALVGTFMREGALRGPIGALLLGVATHIAADLPTGGCQLLAPLSRSRLSFWPYVRTGGLGEIMLLLPTLFLLGWAGFAGRDPFGGHAPYVVHHQRLHGHVLKDIAFPS
ncbi:MULTISPECIES: metal-dependent hydrolase [Gluconobacter]|uniref:metal-dependent hydrolase n=1 Tax=Gluconobacter TaxID=441 RepID=UPI0009BADC13|nr:MULTISPECIES: metal-dependent hydrolase [Gluconobacter]